MDQHVHKVHHLMTFQEWMRCPLLLKKSVIIRIPLKRFKPHIYRSALLVSIEFDNCTKYVNLESKIVWLCFDTSENLIQTYFYNVTFVTGIPQRIFKYCEEPDPGDGVLSIFLNMLTWTQHHFLSQKYQE